MAFSLEFNIVLMAFLVLLSGFFSSVELAVFSISRVKMRRLVKNNDRNAKLLSELKANPHKLLTTILIGNNLVNVAAASVATALALQAFPSEIGIAIATASITLVILVFGEITPKSLALKHNQFIALRSAPVLKFLSFAFYPLIFVLHKLTDFFISLLGSSPGEETLTEEELKGIVSIGEEEGAIRKEEKEMIHRIFKLNDLTVEDIMTPRSEISGVASGTKVNRVDRPILLEYSRIPVYKGDLDDVLGIFHVRDYLGSSLRNRENATVDKLMRKPPFVYASKKIDKLLNEFQRKKTHMAIVVDEYGGTIGLVTIEDILEEIVGEIVDETDVESFVKKVRPGEYLVEGGAFLDQVNKALMVSLKSEEFDTIGGIIIGALDRVPKEKEEITISNIRMVVEKMDGPKIELVRVFK